MTEKNNVRVVSSSEEINSKSMIKLPAPSPSVTKTSSNFLITFIKTKPLFFGLICIGVVIVVVCAVTIPLLLRKKSDQDKEKTVVLDPIKEKPEEEIETIDYEKVDEIIGGLTARNTISLDEFKEELKVKTAELNEDGKVWLVYKWVATNIQYDGPYAAGEADYPDITPNGVYERGITVCAGYSQLFCELLEYIGFECIYVSGYSRSTSYKPTDSLGSHAWNSVKIDKKWCLIDTTWGAGTVSGNTFTFKFEPYYFCTPPEQFVRTHLPDDYQKEYQFLEPKVTLDEFKSKANTNGLFYKYGFTRVSPDIITIDNSSGMGKLIIYFDEEKEPIFIMANIYDLSDMSKLSSQELPVRFNDHFEVNYYVNKQGNYKIQIYATNDVIDTTLHGVSSFFIDATQNQVTPNYFPEYYNDYIFSDIQLISPLDSNFKVGETIHFSLKTNIYNSINIYNHGSTQMSKDNDNTYSLDILISSNEVLICGSGCFLSYNKIRPATDD